VQRTRSTAAFDSQASSGANPRLALLKPQLLVGACVAIAVTLVFPRQGPAQTNVVSDCNVIASSVTSNRPAPTSDHLAVLTATPRTANAQEPAGFGEALRLLDAWVATTVAQRGQPGLSMGVVRRSSGVGESLRLC
jgi:hypothetical protein